MSTIAYPHDNTLVTGELFHYHFYQSLSHVPRSSSKFQPRKRIVPSVPRQHCKAPTNSPLSFIRQHKLPRHNQSSVSTPSTLGAPSTTNLLSPSSSSSSTAISAAYAADKTQQRPPVFARSSADLLTNLESSPTKRPLDANRRPRKVSFNENVMVICTRFDEDEDDKDADMDGDTTEDSSINASAPSTLAYQGRRHSTGGQAASVRQQRKRWHVFVENLKRWPSSSVA